MSSIARLFGLTTAPCRTPVSWSWDAAAPPISSRLRSSIPGRALVRLRAQDGSTVTNHKTEAVRLTDLARHVVTLLDGVHSLDAVARSVGEQMQTDRILRLLRDHALLVA
jgi:hypothetical protein